MTTHATHPSVLFIIGPTASGKTQLSEDLARTLGGEIVNIDVGQFYKPLTVGTAKPLWQEYSFKAHLFDILDEPVDLNVRLYRTYLLNLVHQITARGNVPIVVGGSFFYIKSLFFPPNEFAIKPSDVDVKESLNCEAGDLWAQLQSVDPVRAQELHPHDEYRIRRALAILQATGVQASLLKPAFDPKIRPLFLYRRRDRATMLDRIEKRTEIMIMQDHWVDEAEKLIGTSWEQFLVEKNLIGYAILFDWIKDGKPVAKLPEVIEKIKIQTRQYAKRQETFWRGFEKLLAKQDQPSGWDYQIVEVKDDESLAFKAADSFLRQC